MQNILDDIKIIADLAVKEDLGTGDITSMLTIDAHHLSEGKIIAKADGIISGMLVVDYLLRTYTTVKYEILRNDGDFATTGETVMRLKGTTIEILSYERVMLNFLQHLSGIATYTNEFVMKVANYGCKVLDTRKTLPGMRKLEKKAVLDGRGINHRMGLYAAVLIKENHILAAGSITKAYKKIKASSAYHDLHSNPEFFIQIECEDLSQVRESCHLGVDEILLDNMSHEMMQEAITLIRNLSPKTSIEVSGNVSLESVVDIARLRPDRISIGKITHSAPVLDLSLLLDDILIV
ncbi:carboxylating nicotinate-nucleotide diphosphorylase [Candidatus Magnetaquicoccus inordinatus]|uniref:carboxylating nicotinate-nucleotide diphosphorylase n=1 Tax=Candidatus Magnetaquicoccus inordinatus TaxID=2496818 RepID=UPI001D0EC4D9|nr:carboxylating nicotinate-nucleotide diphosphorylase [Candidatus Magnetaquicoccus inordinatus]